MSSELEDNLFQDESEDEFDWEEVEVPEHQAPHLEITLQLGPKASKNADADKKKGINHAERLVRIDCHKIHTVALIASARQRNLWINNSLLHARLLSLTPLHLQNAFSVIHKSRVPDQNQRGRMFERAVENLTNWWATSFFEVIPDGHIRNRTYDEIQQKLEIRGLHLKNENDEQLDVETLQDIVDDEVETIRSSKSLMKHALMHNGSRDTSAQLFTALCRGLGIPARLVVSVQSVPWQAGVGKPKPNYSKKSKGKGKEVGQDDEIEEASSSSKWDNLNEPGNRLDGGSVPKGKKVKGKQKAKPIIKLRKTKSKGNVLGKPTRLASPDPLTTPPVYWTEVFSRPDSRWFPVDPIRAIVNKRKVFDPTPSSSSINTQARIPTKVENRMVYVVAFEEDGYARDVTRRYAKEYSAKVAKVQGGSNAPNIGGGGKGRQAWWDKVVTSIERPFRLNRDDLEDQELEAVQLMEGMPTTMSGFKDHPLYVLTRHLKQTETIHPPPPTTPELGKFRGEPVYPRSAVVSLKTAENWIRNTGRTVKSGEQPMKMVKIRAGTVNRMRELEVLKDELNVAGHDGPNGEGSSNSGGEVMQGLYAFSQTEPYVPDPVIDGKVPKNNFGNIDLYVPSMLPRGAVHIPFKGVAKIARKLGLDYAEAVTGFEFKKRRAFPILEGVVVAAQNGETLLEAFWEAEREAEEKARIKREERVLKHWTRLIHGLRIRQRLQDQYASKPNEKGQGQSRSHESNDNEAKSREESPHDDPHDTAGGFLAGADKVVHVFHLPKNTHVVLPSPPRDVTEVTHKPVVEEDDEEEQAAARDATVDFVTYDLETMDVDSDIDGPLPLDDAGLDDAEQRLYKQRQEYVPKTMQQMAEDAAAAAATAHKAEGADGDENDEEGEVITTEPPLLAASGQGTSASATPAEPGGPVLAAGKKKAANKITLTLPARTTRARARVSSSGAPNNLSLGDGDGDGTPLTRANANAKRTVEPEAEVKTAANSNNSSSRARGRASGTAAKGRSKPKPKPKSKSTAKRKRGRKIKTVVSGSEEDEEEDLSDDAVQEEEEDDNESDVDMELGPSPSKRMRAKPTPVATPPSTRTLRPRASKTPAQIAEERKIEEAYKKAVAG
ncbi:hypothetical protein CVT25_001769 [Psilocybe cyanescens]|uniref:Rad4 beta-hairpin domain-containing protein n=1 Tax=Psilocybe cyanescens TaxID=93625 RepID=A0A409WPL6_PSICY|nr:hypothetical protein CVT25_001769 [Psilocybe cyanescens]